MGRRLMTAILGITASSVVALLVGVGATTPTRAVLVVPTNASLPPPPTTGSAGACRVTLPYFSHGVHDDLGAGWYGNDVLATNVWMWDDWEKGSRVPVP